MSDAVSDFFMTCEFVRFHAKALNLDRQMNPLERNLPPIGALSDTQSTAIAKSVRDLLIRKGVPKRSQSKKLMEILGLSLSQAHRKLSGSSNWDLVQIKQVADYFGEPFTSLNAIFSEPPASSEKTSIPATFFIEGRELPCFVCVGAPLQTIRNVEYVASKTKENEWRVIETAAAQDHAMYHRVTKLEIALKQAQQLLIAVLDDNEASADNLSDFLVETGFHAEAFYDLDTLAQEIAERTFDAYVIDWLIGQTTAESLIQLIRAKQGRPAPIFLLTGEIDTGRALESDVARVIVEYDVSLQEKPTRLPIITAELSKALGIS
jgi:CheY-like chemotaxis protein